MIPSQFSEMIKETYYLDYTNNLIEGNKENCARIIKTLLAEDVDIRDIYTGIFQRSLYAIGKMWEQEKVSIGVEHAASAITENLIHRFTPYDTVKPVNLSAVIACVDKEFHDIGARMAANIFELNGWKTIFLGASTPAKETVKMIRDRKPDVVGLSFNFYLNYLRLIEVIDDIRKFFPNQTIVVGGQGSAEARGSMPDAYSNVNFIDSIKDLETFIHNYTK